MASNDPTSSGGETSHKLKTGCERNKYFSLPLANDRKTEMYVKFAKVLVIFQGSNFAARSRAVNRILSVYKHSCFVVSDETFKKTTKDAFSPERTDEFYDYFKGTVKQAFETGYNLIVIDQSMTAVQQIRYFAYFAQQMQYVILVVPPLVDGEMARNLKQDKKLFNQAISFREENTNISCPNLFKHFLCGWYLHDIDSAEMRDLADLYLQDCFENIPDFRKLFSRVCTVDSFKSYYNMVDKRQNLALCIVKIFRGFLGVQSYFMKESVMKFYGKMSKLYIVGFIVSPHIIAARVKLTREQMDLWELPDDLDEKSDIDIYPSEKQKMARIILEDCKPTLISSKCNRTVITGDAIYEPTQSISLKSKARSCHIVLGKSNEAKPQHIDYDVPFAVARQKHFIQQKVPTTEDDVGRALVQRYGKYWFIYLKEQLIVDGFFATGSMIETYENLI